MSGDILVVSVTVGGTETNDSANGLQVVSFGPGRSELERTTLTSMDMAGRLLIQWVEQEQVGDVSYLVSGSDAAQVRSRLDSLIALFRPAAEYTLVGTFSLPASSASTWTKSWRCEPADYEEGQGGIIEDVHLANAKQHVTFSFPHDPIPL